jgi:hypothetical protein
MYGDPWPSKLWEFPKFIRGFPKRQLIFDDSVSMGGLVGRAIIETHVLTFVSCAILDSFISVKLVIIAVPDAEVMNY